MKIEIDILEPPNGYKLVGPCWSGDGDLTLTGHGWLPAPRGYYHPVLARRQKMGLVEMFKAVETKVLAGSSGYRSSTNKLRARLAAIEREPTDEEGQKWVRYIHDCLPGPWTPENIRAAIRAAREIGQGDA